MGNSIGIEQSIATGSLREVREEEIEESDVNEVGRGEGVLE